MLKAAKYFLIVFAAFFLFTTCKKYPENTLWFKNPKYIIASHWTLESFTVNGVDSTDYDDMKMYTEKGIDFSGDDIVFTEQFQGRWELLNKKKKIRLGTSSSGNLVYYTPQKNIFRNGLTWSIEKLTRGQFWISINNNNIKYEIRFKN